mmetsp:Transcript_30928/g.78305  ORF Transcript_30928/g.78305 Transcript_30928/m.78305 type:complete len:240 (-) Transcript_30928:270-989(-)
MVRCQKPAVGTDTPLGLPVDPDVYMMYMHSLGGSCPPAPASLVSAFLTRGSATLGATLTAPAVSMRRSAVRSYGGVACSVSVMIARGLSSSRIPWWRSTGHSGSRGAKVRPALNTASCATVMAGLLGRTMATTELDAPDEAAPRMAAIFSASACTSAWVDTRGLTDMTSAAVSAPGKSSRQGALALFAACVVRASEKVRPESEEACVTLPAAVGPEVAPFMGPSALPMAELRAVAASPV